MQIILVRHGQSTNNVRHAEAVSAGLGAGTGDEQITAELGPYPGRVPDPSLSALGVQQAASLGRAVLDGRAPFIATHLYASPTLRAVQTVRPLAEATGLPVMLHPDAYEVGGIHQYDPHTSIRQARPGATLQALREHCPDLRTPPGLFDSPDQPWSGGIETRDEDALPRARRLLTSLREAHGPGDVVIVVSHQNFSQFVLAAVFGWNGPPWRRFRIDNTGHLSLRLGGGWARVDWVNRVDHLDPTDVTN
ncbi:MAG TPA: histidine phosphatase family protein [Kineosporiaceae bacterium]|nr:histidine phosphatase family protein [Kineosporiaceae bacterium]